MEVDAEFKLILIFFLIFLLSDNFQRWTHWIALCRKSAVLTLHFRRYEIHIQIQVMIF